MEKTIHLGERNQMSAGEQAPLSDQELLVGKLQKRRDAVLGMAAAATYDGDEILDLAHQARDIDALIAHFWVPWE